MVLLHLFHNHHPSQHHDPYLLIRHNEHNTICLRDGQHRRRSHVLEPHGYGDTPCWDHSAGLYQHTQYAHLQNKLGYILYSWRGVHKSSIVCGGREWRRKDSETWKLWGARRGWLSRDRDRLARRVAIMEMEDCICGRKL